MNNETAMADSPNAKPIKQVVPVKELPSELTQEMLDKALVEMENEIVRTVYKEFFKAKSSKRQKDLLRELKELAGKAPQTAPKIENKSESIF